jgi:hypothetical protein
MILIVKTGKSYRWKRKKKIFNFRLSVTSLVSIVKLFLFEDALLWFSGQSSAADAKQDYVATKLSTWVIPQVLVGFVLLDVKLDVYVL